MSLQIIYGLSGSGKTEKLIEIAKNVWENTNKKVYFIVPEQYSYETEKKIATRLGVISPKTVEVLSFKRLYYYVCSQVGGGTLPRLTDTGKHILISKAVKECLSSLKILGKSAKYSGFSDVLSTLFSEFKRYNITPESLKEISGKLPENDFLRLKLEDVATMYTAYENEISTLFYDPDDELTVLAEILRKNNDFFKNSVVLIDEFEGFTPQETAIITEMAKYADEVKITLLTNTLESKPGNLFDMQIRTAEMLSNITEEHSISAERPMYLTREDDKSKSLKHLENSLRENKYTLYEEKSDVHIMFALNLTEELEQVARNIIKTVRDEGYRYRDFSIVVRNLESYKNLASGIFEKYDIPLYLNSKTPLVEEAPAYALLSAIKCVLNKWNYNDVFAYLKTGFGVISDEETDLLENYIIKTGIQGNSWTREKPWEYTPAGFEKETVEKVNDIRERFTLPLKKLEENFKNAKYARDYIKAITLFIIEEEFYKKIIQTSAEFKEDKINIAKTYEQVYDAIISAFDDIDSVCNAEEEISAEEFYKMLETAFASYTVGNIPTSIDSVTLTDAAKCRASKCKIMYILGVNDGVFPAVYTGEGVISDDERTTLENYGFKMAPTTLQKTFDEDFVVYATLTHPKERLYLSYPLSDNKGGGLAPSMLIKRVKSIFKNIDEIESVTSDNTPLDIENIKNALDGYAVYQGDIRNCGEKNPGWEAVGECIEEQEQFKDKVNMINLASAFSNTTTPISKENLDKMYRDVTYTSVSKLETYKKCPFMYYAKYLLYATERETTEIKNVDTGNIMHSVVEKVSIKVNEEFSSWQEVTDDWLSRVVEEITDEELAVYKNNMDEAQPRTLWALFRLKEAIKTSMFVVKKQLQNSEFVPMGYEIAFDENSEYGEINIAISGKTFKLKGKIDRADMYEAPDGKKFIRIIDYKSGNKNFKIDELFYGLNLQLAVYLDKLTTQEKAESAGMLYFRLFDPIFPADGNIDEEEAKEKIEKMRKSTGIIADDVELATKMDKGLANGEFTYLPVYIKKDGTFDSYSKVATFEQFALIREYVKKSVEGMCRELLKGKTAPSPVEISERTPCSYCAYKKVCHFDKSFGNKSKILPKITEDEAWEKIEKGELADA